MRKFYVVALAAAAIACGATFADAKTGGGGGGHSVSAMSESSNHPASEARHESMLPAGSSDQAFDPAGISRNVCPAVIAHPGGYPSATWAFCTNQPYPAD